MKLVRNEIALDDLLYDLSSAFDSTESRIEWFIKSELTDKINARLGTVDHNWDEFLDDGNWMRRVK